MEDSGFKKIEVKAPVQTSDTIQSMPRSKRKLLKSTPKVFMVVLVAFILLFGFVGVRAFAIFKAAQKTQTQAKAAYDAIKRQDVVVAHDELVKTKANLAVLKKDVDSIGFLSFIPFLGSYYSDLAHFVNAAGFGVNGGITTTESLIPYADVLGLKGKGSFVSGSAEDRIRLAVKTMGKVVTKIDAIQKDLTEAKNEIDKVNPNRYPNIGVFKKVRSQISIVKNLTDTSVQTVEQGKPLIKLLPDLLGENSSKKYLVLFQNDKELRPTGGFLTFYAIFRVEEGVVKVDTSSDIYNLDNSIPSHPPAPRIIEKYLPKVDRFYIRDSNLSPDFQESMKTFRDFYNKSTVKQKIDGIIAIDTHLLVHILDILGEVQAAGLTFNTKNDPRCDCPEVVYVLEDHTTRPVNYVKENRKGIIGELLFAIMDKALKSSPKQYWGKLFQQGMSDIQNKHILFSLENKDAQAGVESLNWAGKIRDFSGDYLHINDANFGGAKSNLFTKQSVKVEYSIQNGGEITETVTIEYKNFHPYSDCNLERGGLCLNAILRDFQRVYVPKGSELVSSKGSEVRVESRDDLGKTTFESFLTVKPLGKSEISYTYKLPFKLKPGSPLPVLIQKQPGTDTIPYEVYVNGRKTKTFNLVSDYEFTIRP